MSGVYVKGMEMPKNCDSCRCSYKVAGAWRSRCQFLRKKCDISEDRPSWCPLAPAADAVERKKGEWIEKLYVTMEGYVDGVIYNCSQCGKMATKYTLSPFCPNCGAVMRELPKGVDT